MPEPESESFEVLSDPARRALECGDYGRCCQLLEPLLVVHAASTPFGGQLRLLLATAQMGKGDGAAAVATCRSLRACRDATLRAQAKELQDVLEAPALERPREWSMTLPTLGEVQPLEGQLQAMARRRRGCGLPPPPPAPPTGPTNAPLGFALVVVVLLLLTTLLGGCVDLETSLRFTAPGRLQISQISQARTDTPLPWQRQLAAELHASPWKRRLDHGQLSLRTNALPARQALDLLISTLEQGAAIAAMDLPAPQFTLQERNWLLGVHQNFRCSLDLSGVQPLPALRLTVAFEPLMLRAVRQAQPLPVQALHGDHGSPNKLIWTLQPGVVNQLEFTCWRWSRLGLGALLVALLMVLVAVLQRFKLAAGFGLPQLPA